MRDAEERARLQGLAVPPAWRNVWMCPDPNGHVQAVGYDDAGRKQYIYHPRWHERQARKKFTHVMEIGPALPSARRTVTSLLRSAEPGPDLAAATAFRILDRFGLRAGNDEYAAAHGAYGLTSMLVEHVHVEDGHVRIAFPGKADQPVAAEVLDRDLAAALTTMRTDRSDGTAVGYPVGDEWHPLSTARVNDFLREVTGIDMTSKDFRTWHATVRAARGLADRHSDSASTTHRKRAVNATMDEVADFLQNTRAISRNSYVDPRVIDRFMGGEVIVARTYRQAERELPGFVG
ncbi:DNA topoisomerase IB [Brevibacterium yomogidense]